MQEILAQQRNAARPVTGKGFFLGILGVIAKMSIAQIATNLLILLTGIGLINIGFYLYAIWVIIAFMGRTVAGSLYMLKENTLYLQKTLGDSTLNVTEIPLDQVIGVRPVVYGERLENSYNRVTVADAACAKPFAMRLAAALSLVSGTLARKAAGRRAHETRGYIVAYMEENKRCCCVFRPEDKFLEALEKALPESYGADDRSREHTPVTMMAQAMQRAFPEYSLNVQPLVSAKKIREANEAIERQESAKKARKDKRRPKRGAAKHPTITHEEAEETHEVQDDTL